MSQFDKLQEIVSRFQNALNQGNLDQSSEETIRTWLNELLSIFGWNVQDTHQVLQERTLSHEERDRLRQIGSTNTRPDYILVNGKVTLAFLDAKSLDVNIEIDKDVAFQIRSYGWSAGSNYSIVSNFKQLAIYDCSCMPKREEDASFARSFFFNFDEFCDNYETLLKYLERSSVISNNIVAKRNTNESLDSIFSKLLGKIRIQIAESILHNNKDYRIEEISSFVQIIINRILFIRVCETRGLEQYGLLKSYVDSGFWETFKASSYFDFFEHYDGPLFKRITSLDNLIIDNKPFDDFISILYYPSPYCFDVIPLKTLSDIYDIFLGYKLDTNHNGEVIDVIRPEFKRSNGAISTPEHVVKRVVDATLENSFFNDLSIEDILNLKIIDISCGSGVFLVEVYDYLAKTIQNKIRQGESFANSIIAKDGEPIIDLMGRKQIINSCLYGVDINPEAVEVAKMSLCLKVIDDYNPSDFENVGLLGSQILNGVAANIKCGNSLVGTDVIARYPEINSEELKDIRAFDWEDRFKEVFENGGFDYVIGNPPYVEVKNYNVNLPTMANYIKATYQSSRNGKIDLAMPFIERGINLLNDNGRLGYIVQKRFFGADYGKGIRKYISEKKLLCSVYDYEETNIFNGVITYVAILVCDKKESSSEYIKYQNSSSSEIRLIGKDTITESVWSFEDNEAKQLRLDLVRRLGGTLQDVCNIKVGIQTLWNDAYQIRVDEITDKYIKGHSVIDCNIKIERDICRPIICNEDFVPMTTRPYTTYIIFPYQVNNGSCQPISMELIKDEYPLAYKYLQKHRSRIESEVETMPQRNHQYDSEDYWHIYTRANNHTAVYEKIVVPMTAQYTQASVVNDLNVYCDNANMFFIQLPIIDETHLYALSAIINSNIFFTLAKTIANPQQGGYYKFNKQFLDPTPFPVHAFTDESNQQIVELAKLAKNVENLNNHVNAGFRFNDQGTKATIRALWSQIDCICESLYQINDSEREVLNLSQRTDRIPHEHQ